jgi:phosphatidylinositol alpha-1,6-mannosyltransferase
MHSLAFIHPYIYRFARGIERYTINLSSALVEQGADVDVLTWRWPDPISWPERDPRVNIRALPKSRYFAAHCIVPFYVAHLLRHRYDMVYINFADYGEAPALNALHWLGQSQPYTIVLHFPHSQVPHRYETLKASGLAARAERVIAVSEFVAREAEAFLGRECTVISHGVDTEIFQPDPAQRAPVRAELGASPDAPMLLTVSALEERKGVQWMVRALPRVVEAMPNVIYVVVGDGPYKESVKSLADELGVADHVRFLGARTDVARFYQAADLMVILSKGEASSLVSLEAMACGTPVVAPEHPPFSELIMRKWGRQVSRKDNRTVSNTVLELLSSPKHRRRMGKAGRTYVLEHHIWPQVADQYLKLLT